MHLVPDQTAITLLAYSQATTTCVPSLTVGKKLLGIVEQVVMLEVLYVRCVPTRQRACLVWYMLQLQSLVVVVQIWDSASAHRQQQQQQQEQQQLVNVPEAVAGLWRDHADHKEVH